MHPTKFLQGTLCGGCIPKYLFLGYSAEVASQSYFFLEHSAEVASNNILFEAILWNCILTWHSFGAAFRSCIPTLSLWGNSTELYFQNISFKTTLRSLIIEKFLWGNSAELYSQNIHFKITLRSCIPTFCFRATLRSCISTILLSRQFYKMVFSKYSLWGNFIELYSQNISFEATLRSCIFSKHFFWGNSVELYYQNIPFETILLNCILKTFPLRQLCRVVFSKHFFLWQFYWIVFSKPSLLRQFCRILFSHFLFWDNFVELPSHKCLRTLYPHMNKLMVTNEMSYFHWFLFIA